MGTKTLWGAKDVVADPCTNNDLIGNEASKTNGILSPPHQQGYLDLAFIENPIIAYVLMYSSTQSSLILLFKRRTPDV